jgi:hypothetical protein
MSTLDFLSLNDDVAPFPSSTSVFSPADHSFSFSSPVEPGLAASSCFDDLLPDVLGGGNLPADTDPRHRQFVIGPHWSADPANAMKTYVARPPDPVTQSDLAFAQICGDRSIRLNPHRLGFVPAKSWHDGDLSFGQLVMEFFRKKSNAASRFVHKLFNALKLVETDPGYATVVGVRWVSDTVLRVDKRSFARLLGIKTIDGSLFHQQGNFPSHGFVELSAREARTCLPVDASVGVDGDEVRLLVHTPGVFVRQCPEGAIGSCKWISSRCRSAQ